MKVYTIGHSIREINEFISLLKAHRIEALVDIRAFPVSNRNPQFNKENLRASLSLNGIEYIWSGRELGGYRSKSDGLGEKSPNTGWETGGFRIYADYMMTDSFRSAVDKLIELAQGKTVACMCAEKFCWRCHRRLISDYLFNRGCEVWHIVESGKLRKHELTEFARIKNGVLVYPPNESLG